MKRILFILFTILSLNSHAQTSQYHPFPDSNATWNYYFDPNCMLFGSLWENYSITFSGDTIINTQNYHKLNTPHIDVYSSGQCTTAVTYFLGYRGAIRQDTMIKKVFFIPANETSEQLLYDFNLQVGDTVIGYLESWGFGIDTVISIDSVLVGNNYRKRWFINDCYGIYIIEGIGSTHGLIEISPNCVPDASSYSLTCFQQNGQTLYPDTNYNCQLINSINLVDEFKNTLSIFPNPSNGSFNINTDVNMKEIKITDIIGNTVFYKIVISQNNFTVDNLQSGTYIVYVLDENNNTYYSKIICSH